MRRFLLISAAAAAITAGAPTLAVAMDDAAAGAMDSAATPVDGIVVTATRTEQSIHDVPVTVSLITAQQIDDELVTDVKDLIRYEPGVSVRTNPVRFSTALAGTGRDGNSGFNIRGLEGNRVLIMVDGIRAPDAYAFGAQTVGRGDYLDLDLVKSVEILRGPASALYGSDGLAGAVAFTTKDPDDITKNGFGARARVGYSSADQGWSEGLVLAGNHGAWQGLLAYTHRDAQETDNQGDVNTNNSLRTTPNPQDITSDTVLGKLIYAPSEATRFRLTAEHYERTSDADILSARSGSTLELIGADETKRDRVSFDHRYVGSEGDLIAKAQWAVYYQEATTRQFTAEDRNPAADRSRDVTFDNKVLGLSGEAESRFEALGVQHRLVFGGDVSKTRQTGIRDGTIPPVGESFPARPFPITDYVLGGLFIQDQITLLDGKLNLFPALRFDWYDLSPKDDTLYHGVISGQSDTHFSPKLGVVYTVNEQVNLFGNVGTGFKAPSPSQVNNGFANPLQFYESIANPDLKPETSTSAEIGFRFRDVTAAGAKWSGSATVFAAKYDDFIDQAQVSGNFAPGDPAIFQYVNLAEVKVHGAEATLNGQWSNGVSLNLAASTARGDQKQNGDKQPLASIEPYKVVVGLGYRDPAGRFGGAATVTHSGGKENDRTGGTCAPNCFTPSGFTILDVTAYWNVNDNITLRAGGFNLTDEKYWWWGDVRGLSRTSLVTDAYTQPGRNFGASLTLRY
jgi:hemoglobin/transferrin/lactoferrin receptor protein